MGSVEKWCPMCGAAPGEPCTFISPDLHDNNDVPPGRAGDPRPEPHFYRHNDGPISVLIKDEPDFGESA